MPTVTISVSAPQFTGTLDANGEPLIALAPSNQVVTRQMEVDLQSLIAYTQRQARMAGWVPTLPDGSPNPVDCAFPALVATARYWGAESLEEARRHASKQHASDIAATVQEFAGSGVVAIT